MALSGKKSTSIASALSMHRHFLSRFGGCAQKSGKKNDLALISLNAASFKLARIERMTELFGIKPVAAIFGKPGGVGSAFPRLHPVPPLETEPKMSEAKQSTVIDFLSRAENLRLRGLESDSVEIIRTHGAIVFLAGDMAYKIKRAVRYDYLDFSTLEKRHAMLLREIELNAPTAPQIYCDVVPVTREASGHLALNGKGEVLEWVLRMHRFPAENELSNVADRGDFSDDLATRLGASTARYHAAAGERRNHDGAKLIGDILDELNNAFAKMYEELGRERAGKFRADAAQAFTAAMPLLRARAKAGQVRRCHGDLHLRNIVLIDGIPTPFDALEFDEILGTCDVLYDIAFLIMDLRHRGLHRAANLTLNAYLFHADSPDLESGLALMPLFLSIRAAIRAMVAVQTVRLGIADAEPTADARRYIDDAWRYLAPAPVWLVALGGVSGTGKSTLAAGLAPDLGAAPGAVHLRSDLERKALFGVDPLSRLSADAYTPEISARVYARLAEKAARILASGHSVILDAAHLTEAERAASEALATQTGVNFAGLWLTASPEILRSRVAARRGDASDADVSVVNQQISRSHGNIGWVHLDASGDIDSCHAVAVNALIAAGVGMPSDEAFRGTAARKQHETG